MEKLSPYKYLIPKEGKMNTSATLFLDDVLLSGVESDAIQQIKNVTTLPGIVGNALAMPDMHSGYGFPIGGVAAFDYENGVVSPGGIGFDINCLDGNTDILSEFGYNYKIKDGIKGNLLSFHNKHKISACPKLFLSKNESKIYNIKTKLGYNILTSADHPIFANAKKIYAKNLKVGDLVVVYPFEGIRYELPKHTILLSKKNLLELDLPFNMLQNVKELESRGLLPLYLDSTKIPYLLKILGFVTGDGTITIVKNKAMIWFYGKTEDLELIRKDVEMLGYTASKIYARTRKHLINTRYAPVNFERTEYSFKVTSRSFATLLIALGATAGDKTKNDVFLPDWIKKSVLWHKRLYLSALFGADMSSPSTVNKYNFFSPTLGLNKSVKKISNLLEFMNDIKCILEEFNIESYLIEPTFEYNGKKGIKYRARLIVNANPNNLIKFFSNISYEYNVMKEFLANCAIIYIKQKELIIQKRNKIAKSAKELYINGTEPSKIFQKFIDKDINKRFLQRSIWESRKNTTRIRFDFISFDDFVKNVKKEFGVSGFLEDSVVSIKTKKVKTKVYDYTMNHKSHNFVANNYLVSNCGIRLLYSDVSASELSKDVLKKLFNAIPSGLGSETKDKLDVNEFENVAIEGVDWAIKNGYANKDDKQNIEDYGKLDASTEFLSQRAIARGRKQIGTLGSGNHFTEVQQIDKIFDTELANKWGLKEGNLCVMIHTGSRGFGHQVATDFIDVFLDATKKYNIDLIDSQLACVPIQSKEGQNYLQSMNASANFAYVNRQMITHNVRTVFEEYGIELKLLYDVAHNIAKKESYVVDGEKKELLVHRKGATRAFSKNNNLLSEKYFSTGQPVIIPGSMGTESYVLVGNKAEQLSFGSVAHGAGRVMSRHQALKTLNLEDIEKELKEKNIELMSASRKGIIEEASNVYKDVSKVVDILQKNELANPIVKLKPLQVIKG